MWQCQVDTDLFVDGIRFFIRLIPCFQNALPEHTLHWSLTDSSLLCHIHSTYIADLPSQYHGKDYVHCFRTLLLPIKFVHIGFNLQLSHNDPLQLSAGEDTCHKRNIESTGDIAYLEVETEIM